MDAKLLKDLLEVPKQLLGFGRVLALLGHPLDQGDLLGHMPRPIGEVAVRLGEVAEFLLQVGHGNGKHAPHHTEGPRLSQNPFYGAEYAVV